MASRNGISKYFNDEDFDEGEVWSVTEGNSSPKLRKPFKNTSFHSPTSSLSAPRMIPRSSSSSSSCEKQSSAPVEIPDWSKIYGKTIRMKRNGTISTSWVDYNGEYHDGYCGNSGFYHHHDGNNNNGHHYLKGYYNDGGVGGDNGAMHGHDNDDDGGDDNDDDDDDMIPPHEFLARKLARSQISSFSVCEGIGRTLKGRDLSKVRNAILTKTGFLE